MLQFALTLVKSAIACVKRSNETSDFFLKTNRFGQLCIRDATARRCLYGTHAPTRANFMSVLCVRASQPLADFRRPLLWFFSHSTIVSTYIGRRHFGPKNGGVPTIIFMLPSPSVFAV